MLEHTTMSQCNDEALNMQLKYKQRQQKLLQSYKHCRRRRGVWSKPLPTDERTTAPSLVLWASYSSAHFTYPNELRSRTTQQISEICRYNPMELVRRRWNVLLNFWQKLPLLVVLLVTWMSIFSIICRPTDAAVAAGGLNAPTASQAMHDVQQSVESPSSSTPTQQRQLQQQQLFALLKLDGGVPSRSGASVGESLPPSSTNYRKTDHNHYNHLVDDHQNNDDEDDAVTRDRESLNFTANREAALLETTGYVSDDGQKYEKAEKALATDGGGSSGQLPQVMANNVICPKECKCLSDYFDCGKKHLDRVPTLPSYVQVIDFIGNKLNDSTVLLIRNLPELNKLILKRNQLDTMPKFVGLTSLKQLSLAHNRIQRISSEALAVLPKLKSLDLSKNYLHTIETSYFPAPNRLAHLILNANEISSIEEKAFENLLDLLDLELNNNRLGSLPAGVFKSMNKLRKLSLNYNQLEINWSTFRGLTSLQKLFLKSNNIRALQDGVFHVMRSIETIELDHNDISSLSRQGLFNLTKLHHLSLSNNSISRIEGDTWEFTQSLISLDLSHNNISEFKREHLECLQRLKHLNLGHNKIQYLLENTFDCVKNLEDLNLRRNKLSWIIEDPGAAPPFKSLRKLKKLDLYGNNLKQINSKSLSGLSNLEFLNLGGNALASIQSGAFDSMTHLQKLTFKSLNFICDCEILGFKRWLTKHLQSTGQQQSSSVSSQVVCGYPEHLLDRELLSLQQSELICAETPKPKLSHEPSNQLAVKGANITMECRATSPRAASFAATDELKIKWRHDNHNVKEKDRNSLMITSAAGSLASYTMTETQIHNDPSNNQTSIIGFLRLYNVSYELAGKYQCVVSNAFGTTYSQKFKISIGIHPSFLQIPSNITIDSGDTARLVCSATGDPTPEIALQKFGASDFPAATERRLQVLREENAFVITNAKPIDSGIYTCTAESLAGEIRVNASLVVNDKPQPDIPTVRKEVVVGNPSVLECLNDIAAELNQPHREWYKNNKPFHITPSLDSDRYYFTAERELLIIVNTQSVDAARYRCEITDGSKTYTMQMELIVVKEHFSQHIIIIGVVLVTLACIVVGSLIVWIILFYQKKKLYISSSGQRNGAGCGSRVAAAHDTNALTSSRISTLDQTQMTTLNRTYLRSPREHCNHRPRSLAALELNAGRYHAGEDEHQPLTEQRSCLIVTTTPNYQQLMMQKRSHDGRHERHVLSDEEEHLTLEFLRLNTSQETDHQQDHLSSKDSGTGSDAANKRSLEDFSITLIPNASTPTSSSALKIPRGRASLAKPDTDDDDDATSETVMNHNDNEDFDASPTLGVSIYPLDATELLENNNGAVMHKDYIGSSISAAAATPDAQDYKVQNYSAARTSAPQSHTQQTIDI
ncbi:leucine-rich repeats and immunoglobulin-like domains protein 3 [Stomoxys calcitrans]|uniref:leucine-rich repeats and immunoglobulin-like domains protein 3 n=1 Tax=Stomoxys calcitrans TaxID=35570 RepID=UPI0027E3393C|nr:leucine-rich repeats and immunoglobulin-like domains protein 3 [Stomoxys calcitrans]XP_013106714.2 leucine-rich repeats and immunoglobulin-like domains protein 3 [Stomoxys calcitrans]XP_013106715.2 leucine-rich repeats and immunoglobulin-like domains protein 3 [Stomoxys calcitrans]